MRKILIIAGAALAAALVLAGCNKQPASPMPPELSKISVNQEKIGVGQQIVLTAHDVVSASGDLYQTQAFWKINGNQVLDDFAHVHTQGGLNEYLCYYTPSKAGVLDVELEVIMYFNNAPEGEMEKRVTATTELDVLNCDARNSFWGDSVEVTLQREPGLSPTPTSDGIYSGEGESSILGMSAYAKTVRLEYQFEKEKLIGITESFSVAPSTNSSYQRVYAVFDAALRTLESTYPETGKRQAISNTSDVKYVNLVNTYVSGGSLNAQEQADLGLGMVKGYVRVEGTMSSENTDIMLTTNADPDNDAATVILTYKEK